MNPCGNFRFWCQKVLPLVYDESLSYYEVLCKLISYMENMFSTQENFQTALNELNEKQTTLEENFDELKNNVNQELETMKNLLDSIKNGDYVDLYLDNIKSYIDDNLQNLVKGLVNYVSFGLTADGYFCAYIPNTWDFISFSTVDYGEELEGHLVLEW